MCKRQIPDNICQMIGEKVKCHEKSERQSMCILHTTIWDCWFGAGGHEVVNNYKLSLVEKANIFIEDMNKLDIEEEVEFTDKLIHYLENEFARIFKERITSTYVL